MNEEDELLDLMNIADIRVVQKYRGYDAFGAMNTTSYEIQWRDANGGKWNPIRVEYVDEGSRPYVPPFPPIKMPLRCRIGWHDNKPIVREVNPHGIHLGWETTGWNCRRCGKYTPAPAGEDDGNFD